MELELNELTAACQINSPELRDRAGDFPGHDITRRYLVTVLRKEVAFLWYDAFPDNDYLILYEIYVAKRFRWQGIGSELIRRSEQLARDLGYGRLFVLPKPLADGITKEQLVKWYTDRGFVPKPDQDGAYVKEVPRQELEKIDSALND